MSKENLNVNVKIEGLNEAMDKLISFTREIADREMLKEEKENLEENKEKWEEEKAIIKSEFKRISDLMKKTDPATQKYADLANNLERIRCLIGYGAWS